MSILATKLQQVRGKFPALIDAQENRKEDYSLFQMVTKESSPSFVGGLVSRDTYAKYKNSFGRQMAIPVLEDGALTLVNSVSCTVQDTELTTDLVQLNTVTLATSFTMIPAEYKDNHLGYSEALNENMERVQELFLEEIERNIITNLEAEKSLIYNSTLVGAGRRFPLNLDAMDVDQAQKDSFFTYVPSIMKADKFTNRRFHVVADPTVYATAWRLANQGSNNSVNQQFQLGNLDFTYSNSVPVAGGSEGTAYIMPKGSIAYITRLYPDCEMRKKSGSKEWGTTKLPMMPFQVNYLLDSDCQDVSAKISGATASINEKFQFWVDITYLTPYNSDETTKAGGIKKANFLL